MLTLSLAIFMAGWFFRLGLKETKPYGDPSGSDCLMTLTLTLIFFASCIRDIVS